MAGRLYYAEEYHQQYPAENPNGYCYRGFYRVCDEWRRMPLLLLGVPTNSPSMTRRRFMIFVMGD